jgi:hypothetical protein
VGHLEIVRAAGNDVDRDPQRLDECGVVVDDQAVGGGVAVAFHQQPTRERLRRLDRVELIAVEGFDDHAGGAAFDAVDDRGRDGGRPVLARHRDALDEESRRAEGTCRVVHRDQVRLPHLFERSTDTVLAMRAADGQHDVGETGVCGKLGHQRMTLGWGGDDHAVEGT